MTNTLKPSDSSSSIGYLGTVGNLGRDEDLFVEKKAQRTQSVGSHHAAVHDTDSYAGSLSHASTHDTRSTASPRSQAPSIAPETDMLPLSKPTAAKTPHVRDLVYRTVPTDGQTTESLFKAFVEDTGLRGICDKDTPINADALKRYYKAHYTGVRGYIARKRDPERAENLRELIVRKVQNGDPRNPVNACDFTRAMLRTTTANDGTKSFTMFERDATQFAHVLGLVRTVEPYVDLNVKQPKALSRGLRVTDDRVAAGQNEGEQTLEPLKDRAVFAILKQLGVGADAVDREIDPNVLHRLCKDNRGLRKALEKQLNQTVSSENKVVMHNTHVWSDTWKSGVLGRFFASSNAAPDATINYQALNIMDVAYALVKLNKAQTQASITAANMKVLAKLVVRDQAAKDVNNREVDIDHLSDSSFSTSLLDRLGTENDKVEVGTENPGISADDFNATLAKRSKTSIARMVSRYIALAPVFAVEAVAGLVALPFSLGIIPIARRDKRFAQELANAQAQVEAQSHQRLERSISQTMLNSAEDAQSQFEVEKESVSGSNGGGSQRSGSPYFTRDDFDDAISEPGGKDQHGRRHWAPDHTADSPIPTWPAFGDSDELRRTFSQTNANDAYRLGGYYTSSGGTSSNASASYALRPQGSIGSLTEIGIDDAEQLEAELQTLLHSRPASRNSNQEENDRFIRLADEVVSENPWATSSDLLRQVDQAQAMQPRHSVSATTTATRRDRLAESTLSVREQQERRQRLQEERRQAEQQQTNE